VDTLERDPLVLGLLVALLRRSAGTAAAGRSTLDLALAAR
jgi:hypothetical protein